MLNACSLTLFVTHLALSPPGDTPQDEPLAAGPAGCMVQVQNRVLMVRDIWSHRWGLPGGAHDAGETARQTAERETFEETGLRVTARERAWQSPSGFTVYHCEPDAAGIVVHDNGSLVLPKAGYDELLEARLWDLHALDDAQLRYPSQRAPLIAAQSAFGLPTDVLRAPTPVTPFFADELPLIRSLQAGVARIFQDHALTAMQALSQLGSTAAVLVVIVAVWFMVGWRAGIELAYALLVTCLVGLVAKQFFGWPRPFHIDPTLQREAAGSFGFPSGHTLCAAALFGFAAQRVRFVGRYGLWAALTAACAFSRVALGVHFIHDVVAGALLGVAAVWAYGAHCAWHGCARIRLRTWRYVIAAVGTLALVIHPQPPTVAVCALLIGLTLGSAGLERAGALPSAGGALWTWRPDAARRAALAAFTYVAAWGVLFTVPRFVPTESSFLPHLAAHIVTYAALGCLLPAMEAAAHILQRPGACASHMA